MVVPLYLYNTCLYFQLEIHHRRKLSCLDHFFLSRKFFSFLSVLHLKKYVIIDQSFYSPLNDAYTIISKILEFLSLEMYILPSPGREGCWHMI